MRYQNVLNVRNRADLDMTIGDNNPQFTAIQQQITAGFNAVNATLNTMNASLNTMNASLNTMRADQRAGNAMLDVLNARVMVDRARAHNRLSQLQPPGEQFFRTIVKYVVGHPFQNPPAGVRRLDNPEDNVVFAPPQGGYPLGSNPPDGLLPRNSAELLALGERGHIELRRFLRAIYWFYNNPELQLPAQAGLEVIRDRLRFLSVFLSDI